MRIVTVSFFLAAVAAVFFLMWHARRAKYLLASAIAYSVFFAAYVILAVLRLRLAPTVALVVGSVVTAAAAAVILFSVRSGKAALIISLCFLVGLTLFLVVGPRSVSAVIEGVPCVGTYDSVTGLGETVVTYYEKLDPVFVSADEYCKINYGVILGDFDPAVNAPCLVEYPD